MDATPAEDIISYYQTENTKIYKKFPKNNGSFDYALTNCLKVIHTHIKKTEGIRMKSENLEH